jgi:hypothetical protein
MSALVDELSPQEYGEDRIALTLSSETPSPRVFSPVIILVDLSRCVPEGVVLPLEFTVKGPSGSVTAQRRLLTRFVPNELTFRPTEGGSTLVRLAEIYHNRWFGVLVLDVLGDPLDQG